MSTVCRLHLSDSAKRTARALRAQYLKRVEGIYSERHELNLEAVKVLLPADVGAPLLHAVMGRCSPLACCHAACCHAHGQCSSGRRPCRVLDCAQPD